MGCGLSVPAGLAAGLAAGLTAGLAAGLPAGLATGLAAAGTDVSNTVSPAQGDTLAADIVSLSSGCATR